MVNNLQDRFAGIKDLVRWEREMERREEDGKKDFQSPTSPEDGAKNLDEFIYVPSVDLHVAKQRSHLGKNWHDSHRALNEEGYRMLTIPEFIAFLNTLRSDQGNNEYQTIYNEITEVKLPWRSEWLDADFKVDGDNLKINYNHVMNNGVLVPQNSERLVDYLSESKTPGIDIEDWLSNPNSHGLPKPGVKDGSLYYYAPMHDDLSVARFGVDSGRAGLGCVGGPSGSVSCLGVRAVIDLNLTDDSTNLGGRK